MKRVILSTRHPGRSHWRLIGSIVAFVLAFFLTACGDDDSSFAPRDDESSSGVEEDSSSSVKDVILSGDSREGSSPSSSSSIASSNSAKSSSSKAPEPGEGSLMDTRDGQTYRTVTIGTQIWMAENLNYETVDSYCYNDSAEYCAKYGRLYTWAAAMDSVGMWSTNGKGCGFSKTCVPTYPMRGICPEGWHLPMQAEWNALFTTVGGSSIAGKMLKSTSFWSGEGRGSDAYAFSALPAGVRDYGIFLSERSRAHFWSSTESGNYDAFSLNLYDGDNADLSLYSKYYGLSVRCLKD